MSTIDFWQIGFFCLALLLATPVLGSYMARVFQGEKHVFSTWGGAIEKLIYRIAFINNSEQMTWKRYASSLLIFNLLGFFVVLFLQIFQSKGPLNPQNLPDLPWALAFNTAVSFVTNTNWQAYAGETTLSYFTQACGLGVQNFLSAATGLSVLLVLIRGIIQRENPLLGNFWVDMTRAVLYLFLPLSILLALILASQGVMQNFASYVEVQTLENLTQILPMGPVASQEAIKQLGSNGGGFFGTNSAHPFENPSALANFFSMLAMMLIPSASLYMFGLLSKARKHAAALYAVIIILFGTMLIFGIYEERQPNNSLGLIENLEGKETRLGVTNSVLWAMTTTATSNGSVNAMLDSFSPLAGGLALLQILLGEIIFGGVGSGLYGLLLFTILAVFLSGLMIGRTPEYLGKKIESPDIQLTLVAILLPCAVVLIGSSISLLVPAARESLLNTGPHGLSEILYAWGSAANNNGSAFAGLNSNTIFYNIMLAIAMILGRFGVIVPVLAIAGNLATKKISPTTQGSFLTHGLTFVLFLLGVILIIGALTFMPALILGPVAEYFLMNLGVSF